MKPLAIVLLAAAFVGCPSTKIVIPAAPDGAAPADVATSCEAACARIASMCGSLGPNCAPACERDQEQGVAVQLDVGCVLSASTPAAMAACRVPCGDAAVP